MGSLAGKTCALVGKVVQERCRPVAGITVVLGEAVAPRTADAPAITTETDAAGTFQFQGLSRPPTGAASLQLTARAPDGRMAWWRGRLMPEGPDTVDAGILVLRGTRPFSVRVTDGGAPVSGAGIDIRCEGIVDCIPPGCSQPDGTCRFDAVPAMRAWVVARTADPPRLGCVDLTISPDSPQPLEVALRPARTVEVRVLESGTDRPVSGATIVAQYLRQHGSGVPHPSIEPTDDTGSTRILGVLKDETVEFSQFKAPGRPAGYVLGQRAAPGEASVVLRIPRMLTLRFPVAEGEARIPADGTVLSLIPQGAYAGPPFDPPLIFDEPTLPMGPARMEGGLLVVERCVEKIRCLASAPDGSWTRLRAEGDRLLEPAQFHPPRSIGILARRPDGRAAAGETLEVLATDSTGHPSTARAVTDAEGRALLAGLPLDAMAEITHRGSPSTRGESVGRVGIVDLRKGDARIEVTVSARRSFAVRVTIDGVPGVPGEFRLQTNLQEIREFEAIDPETGELRFMAHVAKAMSPLRLTMTAPGLLWTQTTVHPVPTEDPIQAVLDVRSGGVLVAAIRPPRDGEYSLGLLRLDPATGRWEDRSGFAEAASLEHREPDGSVRVGPLPAGRYKVFELASGVHSVAVGVGPGDQPARVSLDLSCLEWVAGSVLVPAGIRPCEVRVLAWGDGIETPLEEEFSDREPPAPEEDGTFRARIPGDRPVTLVPWCEELHPATDGGTATIRGACGRVTLRLVWRAETPPVPESEEAPVLDTAHCLLVLAGNLSLSGRFADSLVLTERLASRHETERYPESLDLVIRAQSLRGNALLKLTRFSEARSVLDDAIRRISERNGGKEYEGILAAARRVRDQADGLASGRIRLIPSERESVGQPAAQTRSSVWEEAPPRRWWQFWQ